MTGEVKLKPKDAPDLSRFQWDDAFRLASQLSEDERMAWRVISSTSCPR
ncbi:hypothetical protein [Xanthobacter autotrophicus]|nr:hypothetical protein [Xanthobacter autotrophicus]